MLKVIFLGSPEPAVFPLKALTEDKAFEVLAVVSQPARPVGRGKVMTDPAVAQYAKEHHIVVFQPQSAKDPSFLSQLKELEPDFFITAAYGQILSQEFLDIPKFTTLNIHPSKLPKFRGATPIPSALLAGYSKTAITILETVKKMDAGPIILQESKEILPHERCGELTMRLFQESGELLKQALLGYAKNPAAKKQQAEGEATHCSKFQKSDAQLDWASPANIIYSRYRAFFPWPGSFTNFDGKRITIEEMRFVAEESERIRATVKLETNRFEGKMEGAGSCVFDRQTKKCYSIAGDGHWIEIVAAKPAGKNSKTGSELFQQMKARKSFTFDN